MHPWLGLGACADGLVNLEVQSQCGGGAHMYSKTGFSLQLLSRLVVSSQVQIGAHSSQSFHSSELKMRKMMM